MFKRVLSKPRPTFCEVDVWSLGVVFFILFSGHPPFSGETDFDVLKQAWPFNARDTCDGCSRF